jgi:hypothetical protein
MMEVLLPISIGALGLALVWLIGGAIRTDLRYRREAKAREAAWDEGPRPSWTVTLGGPPAVPQSDARIERMREHIDSLECRLARALQDVETERTINREGAAPMFTFADGLALLSKQARRQWAKARLSQPWRTA